MKRDELKYRLLINLLKEINHRYEALFNLKENLISDIEFKATHDSLTGLYNRRAFFELAKRELNRIERGENFSVCIAFIDIDGFKRVNDTYGHKEGDKVLAAFGRLIGRSFRRYDIVARFGGDEFVLVMVNCKASDTCLCPAIKRFKDLVSREFSAYSLTISVGVAKAPDDGMDLNALINRADNRMYTAKRSGKNRICNIRACFD